MYTLITFTTPEEHVNLKSIKDEEAKNELADCRRRTDDAAKNSTASRQCSH